MQHMEGSGTPVLYKGRTVLKGLIQWEMAERKEPNRLRSAIIF